MANRKMKKRSRKVNKLSFFKRAMARTQKHVRALFRFGKFAYELYEILKDLYEIFIRLGIM